jgi:hypothetical protein
MDTRAYKIGFENGKMFSNVKNPYKRKQKIDEYDKGFNDGIKNLMSKTLKNKPQMFHNGVSRHNKKTMIISMKGGIIQDVIRENTDCRLIIHDYDIEGVDPETNIYCEQDEKGIWYQKIVME